MKKLLVIDDEKGIVHFIQVYFERKGYKVYPACNSKEALTKIKEQPDLILLDIMMPDMDGLTLCQLIRDKVSCPILFLTAKTEERDQIEGLSVGGDDYILKPFSIEELYARVEAHLRREARIRVLPQNQIQFFGSLWIDYTNKQAGYDQTNLDFAKKEYAILELLSNHPRQTFSKEQIYDLIWGYDTVGDPIVAVTEHIKRIRKKLRFTDDTYIETVWGIGYRWVK